MLRADACLLPVAYDPTIPWLRDARHHHLLLITAPRHRIFQLGFLPKLSIGRYKQYQAALLSPSSLPARLSYRML